MLLGGAPTSLDLLIRSLDPARFESVVACIHPIEEVLDFHRRSGAKVVVAPRIVEFPHTTGGWLRVWNPRHLYALIRCLILRPRSIAATGQLIAEVQPDIVHLNSLVLEPAATGARRAGVPLVWHVRESVVRGHLGLRRWWLRRRVTLLPDAAIFLSADDRAALGPDRPNWHVVPNWTSFDVSADRASARERLGAAGHDRIVLFLGGFSRLKGTDVLLRAMPMVRTRMPSVRGVIAGVVPESSRFAARLTRGLRRAIGRPSDHLVCQRLLPAAGTITTLPFRAGASELLAAADVLAFPATSPHFARPVIEAFAYRVPVVASDLGPVREITEGGSLAILVPEGSPDDLADGLAKALGGGGEIDAMIERAFESGRDRFAPEAGRDAIEHIYREVLG